MAGPVRPKESDDDDGLLGSLQPPAASLPLATATDRVLEGSRRAPAAGRPACGGPR
jgi:hypothetical protein